MGVQHAKAMVDPRYNWSAHADTQHQIAAPRRVLHAGGLERYIYMRFFLLVAM